MTVAPLLVLQARAEARALLYGASEFDLEEALEPLFLYAIDSGITHEFGVDTVMAIIRAAFAGKAEL
jgi:hypothetical protein